MKYFVFLIFISFQAYSYVYTRTLSGDKLRWITRAGSIDLVTSTNNYQGLNTTTVQQIYNNSIAQWSDAENIVIKAQSGTNSDLQVAQNRMYFSSNPAYFGSGVLAVTSMNYSESSGAIYNADIIINDTGSFGSFSLTSSNSTNSSPFLGDVITHEVGHLLGLNHSEVIWSSMIYNVFKGQYNIHIDDEAGVNSLYDDSSRGVSTENWIRGKVVGEDEVPIFGAHVQLIDPENEEVIVGVFTDEDGRFVFQNVENEGNYIVYVKPMKSDENISSYFRNVRSNYCNGKDFEPSFYSSCDRGDLGVPQLIKYEDRKSYNRNYNLGLITVKCSTPVSPEYLKTKFSASTSDYFTSFDYGKTGKSFAGFTGYFTANQVDEGSSADPDKLKIDLSAMNIYNSDTALKINVVVTRLGSPMGLEVNYKTENGLSYTQVEPSLDSDGKYKTDFSITIPLSLDPGENVFDLEIRPFELSSDDKNEIFGNSSVLGNEKYIYHLNYLVVDNQDEFYGNTDDYPYADNASCLEGNVGEGSRAFRNLTSSTLSSEDTGVGCGSIDVENGPGSGPFGSLFVGLTLVFLLGFGLQKSNDFFV